MASSERVELANPQQGVSAENWHPVLPPVQDLGTRGQSDAASSTRMAVDRSTAVPTGAGESAEALEHADSTTDGQEATLWEGQPSTKNYVVRVLVGGVLSIAWVVLGVATWGYGYSSLAFLAWGSAAAIAIFWALTAVKVFRTTHSHHYRLSSRRLIVRTGLFQRRLDQIELLRVKDVFVQQSLLGTWLGIGHVMVLSSEQTLPRATLYGIEQPRTVMDSIWRQTRAELDRKTSRVEHV
jgi:membrane protein YdbS with pleckstrin-like domain